MKKPGDIFCQLEGAIVLFALLVLLIATVVLTAWIQILSSRAAFSDTAFQAQQRRVAQANGRALARQFILERMPSGAITNTNASGSLAGGWGSFSLASASAGYWTNTNLVSGNFFNPMNNQSFAVTFNGTISGGGASQAWSFRVRSRSPLLGGYPLVVHNAGTTNLVWAPTTNIFWTNLNGFAGLPSIPMTSGTNASSTNPYLGYLGAPTMTNVSATSVSISIYTNVVTNAGGNTVEAILNPTNSSSVLRHTPGNTVTANDSSRRLTNNAGTVFTSGTFRITAIRVIGATNTNALHIVIPTTATNLSTIVLSGTNNRRVYINRAANGSTLNLTTVTNFPGGTWRLGMSLSNSPLTVTPTAGTTLTVQGGIRTDQSISVNSGTLVLTPDPSPSTSLQSIADRMLWLEDNATP